MKKGYIVYGVLLAMVYIIGGAALIVTALRVVVEFKDMMALVGVLFGIPFVLIPGAIGTMGLINNMEKIDRVFFKKEDEES